MSDEIWKPVLGFEDCYKVSNMGRVFSLHSNRILKGIAVSHGYYRVNLHRDGKRKPEYIHRLVMMAFEGEPADGVEVNHLNGDPSDNRLENLEYVRPWQNIRHAIQEGLLPIGEDRAQAKLRRSDVACIIEDYEKLQNYRKVSLIYGVSESCIRDVVKRWTFRHVKVPE